MGENATTVIKAPKIERMQIDSVKKTDDILLHFHLSSWIAKRRRDCSVSTYSSEFWPVDSWPFGERKNRPCRGACVTASTFFPRFALSSIHASSSSSSSAPFSPPISSPRAIWWLYRLRFTKTRILRTLRCGIRWDMAWDQVLELRTGGNWIFSCNRFASEALFFLASRSFREGEAFRFVCVLRGVYVCMYVFLP